jgi:hypothetical protein
MGFKFVLEDGVINVYDENNVWRGTYPYYESKDFNSRSFEIYEEKLSDKK